MAAINEPINRYVVHSKQTVESKYPLAGKKPSVKKIKPIVSELVKLKRRPIRNQEAK